MATNDTVRAALARRDQPQQAVATTDPVRGRIEQMRPEFARLIGNTVGVDRFMRVALTELRVNPALANCKPESILGALVTCAQLGLEPGRALGEAWLIPYKGECTFVIGYKGLIKLAWQSDRLVSITAQTVYSGDSFDYAYGLEPYLRHSPTLNDRGNPIAWYACAKLINGGSAFVVLSRADVERIRTRSRAKDSGPWQTDYEAMACKTAVRQLAKFLPMSVEFSRAAAADETIRVDLAPEALDAPEPACDPATGEVLDAEAVPL